MATTSASDALVNLLGANSSITDMSKLELEYFIEILKEEQSRRNKASKVRQIRDIMPIEDWIESEYMLGPDASGIYPYWKQFVVDIFRDTRKPTEKINNVLISGSIGTGKSCLNENTRIPTSLGLMKLKDLKKAFESGKRFTVRAETGVKPCIDVYDNGVANTKKIKFKSGREVEGTYNHKLRFVRDGKIEWVKFEDVKVGDKSLMLQEALPFGEIHMNPNEAYTLGYMVGDGWCNKTYTQVKDNPGHQIPTGKYGSFGVLFQAEQQLVKEKICRAYLNWFGKLNVQSKKKLTNGNTMICLQGYNAELASRLVASGMGSGAENKGIPEFIFRCDKETVAQFIQGLMDADGTVEKKGDVYIQVKSEGLIRDLASLLSMFGINYSLKTKEVVSGGKSYGDFYQLSIYGSESFVKYANEIGFSIDYKAERLRDKVAKCSGGDTRNNRIIVPDAVSELRRLDEEFPLGSGREMHGFVQFRDQPNYTLRQLKKLCEIRPGWVEGSEYLTQIATGNYFFDEVVSIEDGRCHTYDLTIEDDHSYCFGGFISHNTVSEIIMLRKLYELSCFENINAMFHLMSKTNIMFLYFSVNKNQAVNTGYGEFRSMVDASPYFRENFPRRKGLDSILIFPEGVTFAYGSRSSDAIGMSVICAMLDEANFVAGNGNNTSGNAEKALDMFAGIVNRANSRFIMDGGINHALNILVSSSTHESSATARQMSLSKDDPHTIITAPSQWEVKPEKFSKEFFYVFKGSNYLEPSIVNSVDDVNNFRLSVGLPKDKYRDGLEDFASIEREIQELPPHHQERFLKVPVDLRSGFEMNIIRSLQDLGGVSVGSTGKLFSSPIAYESCIDKALEHPFIANEIVISTGDQIQVRDYLSTSFKLKHPERPRFIHIDQSFRSDSTGISSVYVDDVIEQDGVRKPIFAVDFMLRINPPNPPKKIAIYKIRDFVVFLHNRLGMKIGKITYDIFSSEESRQILEEMGFNVGYQSVDRTDKAYLDLVEVMYEGRLKIYDYPILRHELFNLIHYRDKRKVDHPKTVEGSDYTGKGAQEGSKDVSDSLAGALQSALQGSLMEETDAGRTLEDFLKANETRTYFEPDAMTVEELVDRQIDDMIEEMEAQLDGFTMGGIAGFNGF